MLTLTLIIGFLLLGFIGLYFGAKLAIIGLESIANRLGISHLLVGLTILAIGTSLPEITVSIMGGIDKLTGIDTAIDGIVIGNKIGSFFTQITLILGILGISQSIMVSKWELRREGPMLFFSILIFLIFAIDGVLSRIEGILMIIAYIAYLLIIIWSEKKIVKAGLKIQNIKKGRLQTQDFEIIENPIKTPLPRKDIGILLIGLFILLVGAEVTLLSAHRLATELRIPENVIGVLIVGIGTSLPELVADLTALRRRSCGIAVGDILGSNICDILLATGSGVLITDFNVAPILLFFDIPMLLIGLSIAIFFLWSQKKLKQWEAALLIGFYGFYVASKLMFFQI